MSRDLTDRAIAITGASSGIGAATAVACANAGMHVALMARREDRLRDVAQRVEQASRRVVIVVGDVDSDDDQARLIDEAERALGKLSAVYANAGYGLYASVLETSDRQMRDIFETNYFGTLRTVHAAMPALRRTVEAGDWAHVLICSSVLSAMGIPMYGAYAATKAAQDSIAGALRAELSVEGIAVTSVHPARTKTEFSQSVREISQGRYYGHSTPMHSPDKVARGIVRALRNPRAEVWPSGAVKWGLAIGATLPNLTAWSMRKMMRSIRRTEDGGVTDGVSTQVPKHPGTQ